MKKSVLTIPLLLIATLVTIVFGQRYSAKQREEMDDDQVTVSETAGKSEETFGVTETIESEDDQPVNTLESYEQKNGELTLYEYMDYMSLKNEEVSVTYYGDIDMDEAWMTELNSKIDDKVSGELRVLDHTYPDADSYELYIQQTAQFVTNDEPDVIIYGLPALPDKIRDMGLSETEEFMGYVLNSLQRLEDTKLFLLEPYPIPSEFNQVNSRSLDYRSYLGRMQTVSENFDLGLLTLHSIFTEESSADSIDVYFDEQDDLNADGTRHVVTILDELFNEEL